MEVLIGLFGGWLLVVLFIWFIFPVLSAIVANSKGRSSFIWFIMGLLLGPFSLLVALLPPIERTGVTKKCPDCAEIVKREANVCKHCGKRFEIQKVSSDVISSPPVTPIDMTPITPISTKKFALVILLATLFFWGVVTWVLNSNMGIK